MKAKSNQQKHISIRIDEETLRKFIGIHTKTTGGS